MISRPHGPAALVGLGLVAVVFLAFLPVGSNEFVAFDDDILIYNHPTVREGMSRDGVLWALTSSEHSNWSPVTRLGHLLNAELFGMRPGPHHLMSVTWHAGATALLFLALRRLTGGLWRPAFAAALFALHPLRVESVAWAAELKDPISGFFLALTLLAYARYTATPGFVRSLGVSAAFACGLMAKATLLPVPFLLLLLDYWPLGRLNARSVGEKAPLLLLSAGVGVVTYHAQSATGALWSAFATFPPAVRIENALTAIASYLGMLVWPTKLAVFYPHPGFGLPAWKWIGAAILLLVASGLALSQARRRPWLSVGWLWFVGMLVPVLGIIQAGLQGMADRFTYLPMIGLAVAAAWDLCGRFQRAQRRAWLVGAGGVGVLVVLGALTWVQCGRWRTSETLFRHAIAVTERNWMAMVNLGVTLSAERRDEEAVPLLHQAIGIQPEYPLAHHLLGNSLRRLGRLPEAVGSYRTSLRLEPRDVMAHNNLGGTLVQLGQLEEAARQFRLALALKPGFPPALENLKRVAELMERAGTTDRQIIPPAPH